ncbi:MAG: ComEA family DNA-binding protein [Pseudobutyrivibrio sp.]|nr:ComEA family DNA-binding protein [Pseudobutyrivibrio sp.]
MKRILCLVLCSLFLFTGCAKTSYFQSKELVEETDGKTDSSKDGSDQATTSIYVQVAGAVARPDVYELPTGSRVYAAIEAAGGLLESADDSDLNQASLIEDGQKIYVYSVEERESILEADTAADDGLININTASLEELKTLPGIGESKANQIITYRDSNGGFSSVEDIKNVSGIGDGIFNQIHLLIKV